jgi:hypothetical protein
MVRPGEADQDQGRHRVLPEGTRLKIITGAAVG